MNIFEHFRITLNGAFQDLSHKKEGRTLFFVLCNLTFSIISGLAIYGFFKVLFEIDGPDYSAYEPSEWFYALQLIGELSTVSVLIIIVLARYYYTKTPERMNKYSMGDLFSKLRVAEWAFYGIGIALTVILTYYFLFESRPSYGVPANTLDRLLIEVGGGINPNAGSGFDRWLDTVIYNFIMYLPVIIVGLYMIWLKTERLTFLLVAKHWKHFVTFFIAFLVLTSGFGMITSLINQIVLGLIVIPFEEMYIVVIFGIILYLFLTGIFLMVLSKVSYYSFFGVDAVEEKPEIISEDEDLLDQ